MTDVHSCSYYCDRTECIKAQRDELRERLGSMTDRELMQQALEALELLAKHEHPLTKIQVRRPRDGGSIVTVYPHQVATDAAEPLRERLAQPEQEPVATVQCVNGITIGYLEVMQPVGTKLYTSPPQRKPLTDEEIEREWQFLYDEEGNPPDHHDFARAIEAAHGIKGEA